MKIRLASVAPRFKKGTTLDLGRQWTLFPSLTADQVELLSKFHGRWIRVHPDDREALAAYGLRFLSAQDALEAVEAVTETKTEKVDQKNTKADEKKAETSNSKTRAAKADEKKG